MFCHSGYRGFHQESGLHNSPTPITGGELTVPSQYGNCDIMHYLELRSSLTDEVFGDKSPYAES